MWDELARLPLEEEDNTKIGTSYQLHVLKETLWMSPIELLLKTKARLFITSGIRPLAFPGGLPVVAVRTTMGSDNKMIEPTASQTKVLIANIALGAEDPTFLVEVKVLQDAGQLGAGSGLQVKRAELCCACRGVGTSAAPPQ